MARILLAITTTALLVPCSAAQLGTLRLGTYKVDDDTVTVPILLEGDVGEGVSAMDFRLRYDAEVFEPIAIATGQAAAEADKLVQSNLVNRGEYIVLMFGMNQTVLTSGDVAHVTLRVVEAPETGRSLITVSDTTMSMANATAIDSRGTARTIRFEGGLLTEPKPREPEPDVDDAPSEPEDEAPAPEETAPLDDNADTTSDGTAGPAGAAGGGIPARIAVADGAMDPGRNVTSPEPILPKGPSEHLGRVKDILEKIRKADNLRSQLPAAGTGSPENPEAPAGEASALPEGSPEAQHAPSALPEGQEAETTVARAAAVDTPSLDSRGRQARRDRSDGRHQDRGMDAIPAATADGNGGLPLGITILGLGAAMIVAVVVFRRKFLT